MRIEGTLSQPADPGQVYAMYVDPEFQRLKCERMNALSSDVSIDGPADARVVTVKRVMSTEGLVDFVRKLVGDGIEITEALTWAAAGADGSRTARVLLTFAGQPMKLTGTFSLRPSGAGTTGSLAGELKAGIPLLGGRIEKAAAPLILKALAIEESLGREYLDGVAR
jgi:hypothetical protein